MFKHIVPNRSLPMWKVFFVKIVACHVFDNEKHNI